MSVSEQEITDGLNPYLEIDARPSDCIILSLKTGAPLYVTNDIIASEAISLDETQNLDEGFKQFIENLDINEFRKLLDEGNLQQGE